MNFTRRVLIADVRVDFDVSCAKAYDYLVDPAHRAQWQSSLRRVDSLTQVGERPGDVGSSWVDITMVPFVRPAMEVVENTPGIRWTEIGRWGPVDAELILEFEEQTAQSAVVRAQAHLTVPIVAAPGIVGLKVLAPLGLRSDLSRAATILGNRTRAHGKEEP